MVETLEEVSQHTVSHCVVPPCVIGWLSRCLSMYLVCAIASLLNWSNEGLIFPEFAFGAKQLIGA